LRFRAGSIALIIPALLSLVVPLVVP
jgi:hypothetical protein